MNESIQLRQQNLEETEKMAQFESPDGDAICASYIDRSVAGELGEFAEVTVSDEADVEADLQKTTSNYAVYETPGGAVTGLYVSHDVLDADAEDAPESIGLSFAPSSEDEWEEADTVDEEEVEALVVGGTDSDESEEEEVEISDEELDLVEE